MKNGRIKIGTTRVGFLPDNSKRLIELDNEYAVGNIYPDHVYIYIGKILRKAKHNQVCKAEVNGKAKIIELTKQ